MRPDNLRSNLELKLECRNAPQAALQTPQSTPSDLSPGAADTRRWAADTGPSAAGARRWDTGTHRWAADTRRWAGDTH